MANKRRMSQDAKDSILEQVALYQSEHSCTATVAAKVISLKTGVGLSTIMQWRRQSASDTVVKSAGRKYSVAAVSVSKKLYSKKDIESYIKGLPFFKRVLAVFIGLDKLC